MPNCRTFAPHLCTSSWSSWSSPCTRRTRVRDTRTGGGGSCRRCYHRCCQQNFLSRRRRGRKATLSGDTDFVLPAGKTTPKARGRRGGRERRRSRGKGKGKENPFRERAFEASSSVLRARQKRERESGRTRRESGRVTVDLRDVFPDKSIRWKEHHARGKRASFRESI